MLGLSFGIVIALTGMIMCIRGWIYTLHPDGPIARKRQQKNLRLGFTADMKIFGQKIRRLGLLILLMGGFLAWRFWV
jgi:hypothetical protein